MCFDTPANALKIAKRKEKETIERRKKMLSADWAWSSALYFSTRLLIADYAQKQETLLILYLLRSFLKTCMR